MRNQNAPTTPVASVEVDKANVTGPAENKADTGNSELSFSFLDRKNSVDPGAIQRVVEAVISQRFAEAITQQIDRAHGPRISLVPTMPMVGIPLAGSLSGNVSGTGNHIGASSPISVLLKGQALDAAMGSTAGNHFRNPANSETVASSLRAATQEPQANSTPFATRSTQSHQATDSPQLNPRDMTSIHQKDATNAPQRTTAPEAKTELPHESRRVDPRAEVIIPDVSHKNIAQALESALDKMLKGSAGPPEIKIATPAQQLAALQSDVQSTPPSLQPADKGALPSSPQQATLTNQHQQSEQIQTQPYATHQSNPQDNLATVSAPPFSAPQIQLEQQFHLQIRHAIDQSLEQIQNQRAEQLRLIQQITASQTELLQPQKVPALTPDTILTIHPRHESTNLAIEKLRESVLDKFLSIQTQIETTASERQRCKSAIAAENQAIQGRSTLTKEAPIHHDVKPQHELRHSDRSSDVQKLAQSIVTRGTMPLTGVELSSASTVARTSPTTFSLLSLGNILKTLQVFARASTNTKLITKMDSTLERTCLALATGAAVGVVGVEILVKTVGMGLREILRLAVEGLEEERSPSDEALEAALVHVLDEYVVDGALEPSKRSMVADVSGVLICSHTHEPLADVLVCGRELGACVTDNEGRFLFSNVNIGTPFKLEFFKLSFSLSPGHVSGTCGFDSHHRVEVVVTPRTNNKS